jgi:hypothetical protein
VQTTDFTFIFREWLAMRRILGLRMSLWRTLLGDYHRNKDVYRDIQAIARRLHQARFKQKVSSAHWRALAKNIEKVLPEVGDQDEFMRALEVARYHGDRGQGRPKNTPLIRAVVTLALHYWEATDKYPTCRWNDHGGGYGGPFFELVVTCFGRASSLSETTIGNVTRHVISILTKVGHFTRSENPRFWGI